MEDSIGMGRGWFMPTRRVQMPGPYDMYNRAFGSSVCVSAVVRDNAAYNVEASTPVCAKPAYVGMLDVASPVHFLTTYPTDLSRAALRELLLPQRSGLVFLHNPKRAAFFQAIQLLNSGIFCWSNFFPYTPFVRCSMQVYLGYTYA
jgi:hypothetical protein